MEEEEPLTAEELEGFRSLLQTERDNIQNRIRELAASDTLGVDYVSRGDDADRAKSLLEQNLTLRMIDRDRKLLTQVDMADRRITNGSYGVCEGTGEQIPRKRLTLMPWCRYAAHYKEQRERKEERESSRHGPGVSGSTEEASE